MKTMAATDAKTNFGKLLDAAQAEPVRITKKDRSVAVVMSEAEFDHYEALEDAYWLRRAEEAQAKGDLLGPEESMKAIRELLDRADP